MPNPRPPEHAGLNLAVKQYRRSSSWERKVRSSTASGVDILSRAIERFEAAAAGATVQLSTTPLEDRLGPCTARIWVEPQRHRVRDCAAKIDRRSVVEDDVAVRFYQLDFLIR